MCSVCTETKMGMHVHYRCDQVFVHGLVCVFACLPSPGCCIYVYNHMCFFLMARVHWCVWVAVHTHVSCWVSLVAVPHHCSVPPGLCCWLHSALLFCCDAVCICFVFSSGLPCCILLYSIQIYIYTVLLLKVWLTGVLVKSFASVYFTIQIITLSFNWSEA